MDLILHRPAVYRHFLFNASAQQRRLQGNYVKLFLITLFFATYVKWYRVKVAEEDSCRKSDYSIANTDQKTLRDEHLLIFFITIVERIAFIGTILIITWVYQKLHPVSRFGWNPWILLRGVTLASFGSPFFLLMVVWAYSPLFIALLHAFILAAHVVAVSVYLGPETPFSSLVALLIILIAHVVHVVTQTLITEPFTSCSVTLWL
jgi:hypothetical protein